MTDLRTTLQAALGERYRVEQEQGVGGLARVFRATQARGGREVLVAVVPPAVAVRLDAARFRAAIEDAGRVRHPSLSAPIGVGAAGELAWVIYPHGHGETLRERLGRGDRLSVDAAVRLLTQVAGGLAVAHDAGMVHGDVRPECVSFEGGRAVLYEFGLAYAIRAAGGGDVETTGSAGYAAPEQESGQAADTRCDVYALGVIGYEVLAGFPPFAGPTAAAVVAARLTGAPEPLGALRIDVPPTVSTAITRALARDPTARFGTAGEFREALRGGLSAGLRPRRAWLVGAAALLGIALVSFLFAGAGARRELDPNLLVVAPFDVLARDQELWREGLVDVLSRHLDGAGPLRTVAPAVAVRRWRGRVDVGPAAALARATGAGLAVFGRLLSAGDDSVRLVAGLVNATTHSVEAEFDHRAPADRVESLADSLAFALLRELGRTRPIGAVPRTSVSPASLPALKAFLQGEQYFRRANWDSAILHYERAIALDPNFAPALYHLSLTLGWQRTGADSLSVQYAFRGGAANRGLAPRDSFLVASESLSAALWAFSEDPVWWSQSQRLFATLGEAVLRYPEDPEMWYQLGEARYHFGYWHGIAGADALRAFDRAIALDSAFAPAFIHPVELALSEEGPAAARRYAGARAAGHGGAAKGSGVPLVARLLRGDVRGAALDRLLDTLPADAIHNAWLTLSGWPDEQETSTRLIRYLATHRRSQMPISDDTLVNNRLIASQLAFRGHLREAGATADPGYPSVSVERALAGSLPRDSAAALFSKWVADGRLALAAGAIPWWAAVRDTAALLAVRRAATMQALPHERLRRYLTGRTDAYLSLARGDSAEALRRFTALPESLCGGCQSVLAQVRLTTAQLLNAAGRHQEAATILAPELPALLRPLAVFTALERARTAERLGHVEAAVAGYEFVAGIWRNADEEYRPFVEEARTAIARLTAESRVARRPPTARPTTDSSRDRER